MSTTFWCSGRVYACVVRDVEPTDAAWERYIELCRLRSGQDLRVLAESYKTGPNAKQRKALAVATADIDYHAAILTDSIVTRGIVTAFAWMGMKQRAFAPNHLAEAGNYLQLEPDELEIAS
jgi:hypothetical protein